MRGRLVGRAGDGSGRRRTGSTLLSLLRLVLMHITAHGHAQLKGGGARGGGEREGHAQEGEAGGHGFGGC